MRLQLQAMVQILLNVIQHPKQGSENRVVHFSGEVGKRSSTAILGETIEQAVILCTNVSKLE